MLLQESKYTCFACIDAKTEIITLTKNFFSISFKEKLQYVKNCITEYVTWLKKAHFVKNEILMSAQGNTN